MPAPMIVSALLGGLFSLIGAGVQGGMQSKAQKEAAEKAEVIGAKQNELEKKQLDFAKESTEKDLRRGADLFSHQKKMDEAGLKLSQHQLKQQEEDVNKSESIAFKDTLRRGSRIGKFSDQQHKKSKLERI